MQLFKSKNSKSDKALNVLDRDFMEESVFTVADSPNKSRGTIPNMPGNDEIAKIIRSIEGFNNLTDSEIDQLLDQLDIVAYDDGDTIIEQGKPGYSMHIILKGKVKVEFIDEKGKHHLLDRLKKGEIFGEMSILTGKPRSANVIADAKVITCIIDKQTLKELIGYHPDIARFITQIIRERIDKDHAMAIGPYVLQDEIGHGSIALIYKGQCSIGRDIAVKMLRHDIAYRKKFRKIFFEEAKIMAQLRHPNIIRLYGVEEAYGTIFIIMEYLNGVDLKTYLRIRKSLSPLEALQILHQIAEALRYAHAHGVIHRDVKPSNCIVTQEFGEIKVTLTDFGLAREQEFIDGEQNRRIAGTPLYISPEAAQSGTVDFRADIYALGIIAYELLIGQVPFLASSVKELLRKHINQEPPKVDAHLPLGLRTFISKALIKAPQKRISDWNEIFNLLSSHENIRQMEYSALSRINKYKHAGTSKPQLIKQALKEGERLVNGTIIGHIMIKAGKGQLLTEEVEEICYDILKKYNVSNAEIEKQLAAIKTTIETGESRKLLLLLGTSNEMPQELIALSDLLMEINPKSDFYRFLSTGMGYFSLNTNYASFLPIFHMVKQINLINPISYAFIPLTPQRISWVSGTEFPAFGNFQTKQDLLIAGCIQIFQHTEEYNSNCFLEKLKAFQLLISQSLMAAYPAGEFTNLPSINEQLDLEYFQAQKNQYQTKEKLNTIITGDQIYQRNVKKQFKDEHVDSQMLKVYMELDGRRNLKSILLSLNTNWDTLKMALSALIRTQAVKALDQDNPIMDQEFIDYLKKKLSLAMGPVAEVFFEESLEEMGFDSKQLSNKQASALIEFIVSLIPREEKKEAFKKDIAQELKKYG